MTKEKYTGDYVALQTKKDKCVKLISRLYSERQSSKQCQISSACMSNREKKAMKELKEIKYAINRIEKELDKKIEVNVE